ncbi:conserved hypothetical protein [Candidatus Accumulibacter aalborgensis]|uniref:Uncharacterized protein n=1 Tax=Candidatus Accumulibacter aalborgensis TaxID=1860102 RepID=A0A1A8XHH6_9PROT|nr:PIN domain-containing protein [Candidatus Accumulibacter aalborgensis]SBT04146.1 conserved hypothetical protein [Candidatus Accumulibacter aalborgensis]
MRLHFTVIYDACVLYPAPLRDFLMRLALTDLYRACWTEMIHDEWIHNVHKKRPDLKREDLDRTRALMNAHVRDSLVTGFEHLIPSIELPDSDDRHVVAAAIHGGATLILTFNLKDFPEELLRRYNLAVQHPDDFIFDLLEQHPASVCEAAATHRRSLKNPPKTADEYLDTLLKQGLTQTVGLLREWKVVI